MELTLIGGKVGGTGVGRKHFVWKRGECAEQNQLQPHLKRQWCIRQFDGKFLWQMERILHLYALPYNPESPVVCFWFALMNAPALCLKKSSNPFPCSQANPNGWIITTNPKGKPNS